MAYSRKKETKDGRVFYEIMVHSGRNKPHISRRWYVPEGWSERAIQRELAKQEATLESAVKNGEVVSRAERKAAEVAAEREKAERMTVQKYVETVWMPRQETRCTASSCEQNRYQLNKNILPKIGGIALEDVTPIMLNELILEWTQSVAYATAQFRFFTLKGVLHSAFLDGLIQEDIIARVRPPRRRKNDPVKHEEALTAEEVRILFNLLDNEPLMWRCFVRMAILTGMRQGELSALRWSDISSDGTITVRGTLIRGAITKTKTGKERNAMLGDAETLSMLQQLRKESESLFVFVNAGGAPLDPSAIATFLKRMSDSFGKRLHIHLFRKTFSVLAQENGAAVADTSKALGHSTPATTQSYYSTASSAAVKSAARAVCNAICYDNESAENGG